VVLFSLVSSHKNVDLNTVATLTTGVGALGPALVNEGPLKGLVTLSTCNRLELYGEALATDGDVDRAVDAMVATISDAADLDESFVRGSFEILRDEDAASHLFTVVTGLESAVVGEREITGQVRRALMNAREEGTASGELIRLFEAAARAALSARGCHNVWVYSASGRAEEFTAKRGGTPVTDAELTQAMTASDVIIGCSGGSTPFSSETFPEGNHIVVDMALTRDFDPSIADLDGVELITLESVRLAAPEEANESVSAARAIVEKATREFRAHRNQQNVDDAIVALRRHTMAVLDTEMDKVRHQYGCGAQADQLEFAMRRMMHSLLHTPMVKARKLAAEGREQEFMDAIEALYDITVPEPAAEDSPEADTTPAGHDVAEQQKAS